MRSDVWYADFIEFLARERAFATLLTPAREAGGDPNKRWDTSRNAVFNEILGFYANYQSCRWVGDLLVLRVLTTPSKAELADLNRRFADIIASGSIRPVAPLPPERSSNDALDLARVALRFDRYHFGRLRMLIDALNECTG